MSILSAARANVETKGEVTSNTPTCSSSETPGPNIPEIPQDDQARSQRTQDLEPHHDVRRGPEEVTHVNTEIRSQRTGDVSSIRIPAPSDPWTEVAGPATSQYFRSSRLWTISCNHPGSYGIDERAAKKRRVAMDDGTPRWVTKIVLLGGCNSTTSTVHTIFHNIQPFSVVTGVTVVRDNLCHDILPDPGKNHEQEWEECGSLSQLCYGCAATTAGTKAYVFGGKDANSQYLAEFQEFDMCTNTSRRLARGPQPKEDAVAVRIGMS